MQVKRFRMPRLLVATVAQGRTLLRGTGALARALGAWNLLPVPLAAGLGLLVWPHDAEWLRQLHFWGTYESTARNLAWQLGTWGDFPTYNIPLALLIWGYGVWRGSARWRRVALVCLLGAGLAGLADDCLRLSMGRPRPDAHLPDGFYGFGYVLQSRYQSFPSGHAASVIGAAAALYVVARPLGILAGLYGLAVVWARVELERHYPSDVLVGSILGLWLGLLAGHGSRFRRAGPPALDRPRLRP